MQILPIPCTYGTLPWQPVLALYEVHIGATWQMTEPTMCGGDAALRQITLTTCFRSLLLFQILVIDSDSDFTDFAIILLTCVHVHTMMEHPVPQGTVHRRWLKEDWIWPQWHRVSTSSS